jgi:hypothetical protein
MRTEEAMMPRALVKDEKTYRQFPLAHSAFLFTRVFGRLGLMAPRPTDRPDMMAGSIGDGRDLRAPTAHHRSLIWGSIRASCRRCGHSCEVASVP